MAKEIYSVINEEDLILTAISGSKLYGTDCSSSDTDFYSIYLPRPEDLVLGKVKHVSSLSTGDSGSKNSSDDIDHKVVSLHRFISEALQCNHTEMDILHIGGEHTKVGSKIWDRILENRSKFYSKMLRRACSFLNSVICEHHFDKNKIDDARKNIMHLGNQIRIHTELHGATVGNSICLSDIWDTLIETENFSKCSIAGSFFYDIFGKRYISSTSVGEIIRIISIKHKALSRIDCSQNKVDWKHISHAFRIGLQTRAILTDGCFKFPIDEISLVRDIKFGRLDLNNDVLPKMISIREELLELINKSELPDVPDLCFWNNFILECYSDFYGIRYALPLVSLRE